VTRLWAVDGAAQESNLPSRGLHDRTGFVRSPEENNVEAFFHRV
jgi:hypothetical protein